MRMLLNWVLSALATWAKIPLRSWLTSERRQTSGSVVGWIEARTSSGPRGG